MSFNFPTYSNVTVETPTVMAGAPITVRHIADSITDDGCRIVTQEWTYPRAIHSEVLTHGDLRRNSASSRAIPAAKLRQRVIEGPAVPVHWGQNQAGMQADNEVADSEAALAWWLRGRDLMVAHHAEGEKLGLHKQIVNRVIEPWMMITIIISATNWANFFHLRKHKDAEPNFQVLASLAWDAFTGNMPTYRKPGEWHLPMIREEDHDEVLRMLPQPGRMRMDSTSYTEEAVHMASMDLLKKVSTGRCARVSYLTHAGTRDLQEDIALHDKLLGSFETGGPGHFSPFEHPAMAVGKRERIGPYEGWKQYRKFFARENGPDTSTRCLRCGLWTGGHVTGCPATM